jgi:hypothetical protein
MTNSKLIKDQYSRDADENDSYLAKMEELAKDHPEIKPELHDFRIYQAGFTNGVLNQVKTFYEMVGQVKHLDENLEAQADREFLRDEFEGVDCISFKNQTIFTPNITLPQFSTFIDQMAVKKEIPKGYWGDDEAEEGNIIYWFDRSHINDWIGERLDQDFDRAKAIYYYEKKRLELGLSRDDFIQYNKDKTEEHQRDSENVEAMKNDYDNYREGRLKAFLKEKKKYETAEDPFPKDPEEEAKYVKVKVKPKKGRPKGSKNKSN